MVIQRSWKNSNPDVLLQNSSSEDSSGSWQLPTSNRGVSNSQTSNSMPNRHVINRQVALNTLAAMHRRYNIPGMVQTSGRPPAEFRASANKSLDILRQNIQSAVTKEIDQVIKKYLEKFFVPAVNNIRSNLGEESVGEDQVRAVCRAMLDGARCLYAAPPRSSANPPSQTPRTSHHPHHAPSPSELSDSESSNGADSRFGRPSSSPSWKRKESDTDSDVGVGTRRKRRTEGAACSAHKWDPARLNPDTLFIMGSIANKVLGLGQSRGRLYSKHAGLLRYPADSADKEWIANQNMTTPAGGRTYIMVLEDIEELVCSEDYRHSPALRLNELSGFRAPPFMLRKIQAYLCRRGEMSEDYTSSTPTPTPPPTEAPILKSQIKLEELEDSSDVAHVKVEQVDEQTNRDNYKNLNNEDIVEQQFPFTSNNQLVKMEHSGERSFKYDNNGNSQQIIQPCSNFTSIVSAGVSNMDNSYWKCISGNQQLGDNSEKVELNAATEFIDADIEFLSSDFCTYVDSEADVKKSFDRISDGGGGGDLFMSGDTNLLSSPNSSGVNTHLANYNQPLQETVITRPGIVTSFMGSIAVGPMASSVVHTYVSASPPNTLVKSPSVTTSHITLSPSSFSHPNNAVTFTQALNTFSQSSPISHSQVISQISPSHSNANTITLQPNIMQPTTRTVYSLASTNKSLTPGSTIIGFGTRPAIGGNIINASNFINIATKNFSSGNILHNAIVSRNMINRGMNITRSEISKPTILNTNTLTVGKSSTVLPCVSGITYSKSSHSKLDDDASITTTKAMIDNTCNSSAMLKKVLTLGSAGVNKTFLTPPTQKMNTARGSGSGSNSSNLSASHATLTALLSSGSADSTHSDKKSNSFIVPTTEK